jgi:uncharacterized protein (TIGR02598 family)
LIEVVLAVGIVAFAFISLFSLIPLGMGVFREAMDTSVSAQIVQRIASDAQETEFDTLIDPARNGGTSAGDWFVLPLRYFDDQGSEVKVTGTSPTGAQRLKILYHVRVRGSKPGGGNPSGHTNSYFTSLPSTAKRFNPRDMTILTAQIVTNPAGIDLATAGVIDESLQLIDAAKARTKGLRLQTAAVAITRNGKDLVSR